MNRTVAVTFALFLALGSSGTSAQVAKLSDLSGSLAQLRDACATKAEAARSAFSTAQYQAGLDADLANQQAQMDARVYGVGHGRSHTTTYLINRMAENQTKMAEQDKAIGDKFEADSQAVVECKTKAGSDGKALYSTFKASHKKKKAQLSEANALVTAWLTNLNEISSNKPQGSDATNAAWKTAMTHAELSDL